MKKDELKKPQVNEVDLSSFIGGTGAAAVRSGLASLAGKPALSTQDQLAKDNFIKSFVSKTATELDSAIKSGMVKIGGQKLDPKNPADAKILQKLQQQQGTTAPETPSAEPAQATATPQTPEQIRKAKQAKAAQAAQAQMRPAIKAAPKIPQTPEQIRKAKQAKAAQIAQAQMKQKSAVKENTFNKLNQIFESIMNLTEQSVSDFISTKTLKYLGSSAQQYMPQIQQLASEVERAYGKGGFGAARAIKDPLTKLANLAYSVASTNMSGDSASAEPAQSSDQVTQPQTAQAATATEPVQAAQPSVTVGQINKMIPTLKGRDLVSIKKTIDATLSARQAKRTVQPSRPAAPQRLRHVK